MRDSRANYFLLPTKRVKEDDLRDVRRLFYVALTRARAHVEILYPLKDDLGKSFMPLRFIEELDSTKISKIELPPVLEIAYPSGSKENYPAERNQELLNYAKETIVENGISVTALNHYLKCPSEFLYQSILKLPEAPTGSSEKGSAMHEAISQVWKLKDKTESSISETIKTFGTSYVRSSLLSLTEKQSVVKDIEANAPTIGKALFRHFALRGSVSTEAWFERPYSAAYQDEKIQINLHGKLDAVVETENQAQIFDYKTRRTMSVREIRGETKGSNGNYLRQLAFYNLLVRGHKRFPDKRITTSLVFIEPDNKGRCEVIEIDITKGDIEELEKNILSLVRGVWSGQVLKEFCQDQNCQWCALKKFAVSY